jgi:hypothetical protein
MDQFSLTRLELTFSPISNYLGDNLWNDGEFRPLLSSSRLYMIAQRAELLFENLRLDQERNVVCFDLRCGQEFQQGLEWSFHELREKASELEFEGGAQYFKFSKCESGTVCRVLCWLTPDVLLWQHSRGVTKIAGIDSIRPFWNFRLLYVGISKKGDSFSRLFGQGHIKRTAILSRTYPIEQGARTTDELALLFFNIRPIEVNTIGFEEDSGSRSPQVDEEAFIADAEKALVHVLKPPFNEELYENYPHGDDGLYKNSEHIRYGYVIDELLSVQTPTEQLRGGHIFDAKRNEQPDGIMVDRQAFKVSILRAEKKNN